MLVINTVWVCKTHTSIFAMDLKIALLDSRWGSCDLSQWPQGSSGEVLRWALASNAFSIEDSVVSNLKLDC